MLQVIYGEKGTGKSKRILNEANERLEKAVGSVVYIDKNKSYTREINYKIRFVDASEYSINSPKMFYGFLCGIIAQDFDLEAVYVDGFLKIVQHDQATLEELFTNLNELSDKFNFDLIISLSGELNNIPEFINKYIKE